MSPRAVRLATMSARIASTWPSRRWPPDWEPLPLPRPSSTGTAPPAGATRPEARPTGHCERDRVLIALPGLAGPRRCGRPGAALISASSEHGELFGRDPDLLPRSWVRVRCSGSSLIPAARLRSSGSGTVWAGSRRRRGRGRSPGLGGGEDEDHDRLAAVGDGAADGVAVQPGEVTVEDYHVVGYVEAFR